MKIEFVLICVVLLLFSIPVLVSAQQPVSEMQQARDDIERDAEKYVSPFAWGTIGFGCDCFGFAYLETPEVPTSALLGKTLTYVDTYTPVYHQNTKRRRMQAAAIACGVGSVMGPVSYSLYYLQLSTLQTNYNKFGD